MKKNAVAFTCFASAIFRVTGLYAAPPSSAGFSSADRAWMDLQAPTHAIAPARDSTQEQAAGPAERKAELTGRAASLLAQADRARDFYTHYPQHEKNGEAKLAEVRALVGAMQMGDATVEGRAASLVQAVRSDRSVPDAIQVQVVSTYEFSHQMRGAKNHEERLAAIERVARNLAAEFPEQPQGYDSLLTVAATTGDDQRAKKIAHDLLRMPAPAQIKDGAQELLARFDLVGRPLRTELEGANEISTKATLRLDRPTVVYSWATWSPGSLALADRLRKSGLAANFVGLNLDTDRDTAEALAQKAGLIGRLVYDDRGKAGALAQRLKISRASQVFIVDAQGIIRDVHGESDLGNKLKQLER